MFPTFVGGGTMVNDPLNELMGIASVIPGTDVVVGVMRVLVVEGGEPAPSVLLVQATVAVYVPPGLKVSYVAVE
jgi:hypothetical protein